ncbi:multidrug efflux MFS transporter [Solimonas sp. C16B3]|uniref:Multidrug efflux MFS transporter n=2 Tax=Solimonas marina TaxID=2714601 RepID=A0A969W8P7_9GAMM|nr:multidrug efflux MFS transporter [Solimonas marina]
MEQLDATVLATALPAMARDFGVHAPDMSIVMTVYLLMLAALIPASGAIADRYGLRRVFAASIVLFTAASVICSLANNLPQMVAARVLQGLGGAMMTPLARLILLRAVDRHHLVSAMAWTLVPAFMGPLLGPPVGGLIVSHLDWRWIFYINVPIGIVGFVLVRRYIPYIASESAPAPFDLRGFVLCAVSLGCLLFGLEGIGGSGGSGELMRAAALLLVGLLAGLAYLWHARHRDNPLLDLSLLRIETFRLSVIGGSLMRITQGAQPFLLPLMFQLGFGYPADKAGRLVMATACGALVMRILTPRLLRRFGFRRCLIVNGVLASLGYAVCAFFRPGWPPALMFALLVCCGAFMSLQFAAYNTIAYDDIPASRTSAASSLYTTLQQLMLSFGVCSGALTLKLAMAGQHHEHPQLIDFSIAFIAVTLISLSSTRSHLRFSPQAGASMSGQRR